MLWLIYLSIEISPMNCHVIKKICYKTEDYTWKEPFKSKMAIHIHHYQVRQEPPSPERHPPWPYPWESSRHGYGRIALNWSRHGES